MRRSGLLFVVAALLTLLTLALPAVANAARVCWPAVDIPGFTVGAIHLPAQTILGRHVPGRHIPGRTIPRTCVGQSCFGPTKIPPIDLPAFDLPAVTVPAVSLPARTFPAQHIPAQCFNVAASFAPAATTVRVKNYAAIDPSYSPELTQRLWEAGGSSVAVPVATAPGFGELNAAGFPKNQYVRSYVRRDGTVVGAYWRNSPSDGLPTCKIISC